MNQLKMIKIPLFFIRLCESINLRGIERFYTKFWLPVIRLVAHSLSDRLIKDVLQFNGISIVKRNMSCEGDGILKIYENSKVKIISKFQKYFK